MARKSNRDRPTTSVEKAVAWERTSPLLNAMYTEIQELSKKKPDATLNESKVKLINRLLTDVKGLLSDEPEVKYLDLLDDEALPQFSDVVLLLSQYSAALKRFRHTYFGWDDEIRGDRWFAEE
jgi:hypothetical protein